MSRRERIVPIPKEERYTPNEPLLDAAVRISGSSNDFTLISWEERKNPRYEEIDSSIVLLLNPGIDAQSLKDVFRGFKNQISFVCDDIYRTDHEDDESIPRLEYTPYWAHQGAGLILFVEGNRVVSIYLCPNEEDLQCIQDYLKELALEERSKLHNPKRRIEELNVSNYL